jgi:hypothetical protein
MMANHVANCSVVTAGQLPDEFSELRLANLGEE